MFGLSATCLDHVPGICYPCFKAFFVVVFDVALFFFFELLQLLLACHFFLFLVLILVFISSLAHLSMVFELKNWFPLCSNSNVCLKRSIVTLEFVFLLYMLFFILCYISNIALSSLHLLISLHFVLHKSLSSSDTT